MFGRKKADRKKRRGAQAEEAEIEAVLSGEQQFGELEACAEEPAGSRGTLENELGAYAEEPAGSRSTLEACAEEPAGSRGTLENELDICTKKLAGSQGTLENELDVCTKKLAGSRSTVEIGTASIIGSRKSQQDSIFGYASGGRAIGIVCDGMGGLAGGERASCVALESLADAWFAQEDVADVPDFFRREAVCADEKVYMQKAADGSRLQAGTTVVAVMIQKNELYWLSVGDSRLYFIRGQEILSLNEEHNYRMELNAMLRQGRMTAQEYAAEEYRAEALISYLGIGNLSLMDINPKAYELEDQDIMLLASDGLYRSLSEDEILAVVRKNGQDMQKAAEALTAAVQGRKKQDNTSVVVLRYHADS